MGTMMVSSLLVAYLKILYQLQYTLPLTWWDSHNLECLQLHYQMNMNTLLIKWR